MLPSRSKLGLSGLGSSQDIGASNGDLYYNSRPESHLGWTYQPPPPPVITQQPKPATAQHFQPYERGYPKTLESLAEKVRNSCGFYNFLYSFNHSFMQIVIDIRFFTFFNDFSSESALVASSNRPVCSDIMSNLFL